MKKLTKCVTTAVCIALCVVLPLAFHAIPKGGTLFSPMHFPVLVCGLVCGLPYGFFCGLAGPLLSCLITGMPGLGYLPVMMTELAAYGLLSGLFMKYIHTGRTAADVYISLVLSMIGGRLLAGLVSAFLFSAGNFSLTGWAVGYFVSSFPGIVLQILIVPGLYFALKRAGLASRRY